MPYLIYQYKSINNFTFHINLGHRNWAIEYDYFKIRSHNFDSVTFKWSDWRWNNYYYGSIWFHQLEKNP